MSAHLPKFDWESVIEWMHQDERDDFFPDVVRYRDIEQYAADYVKLNERKLFQYSRHPYSTFAVPKSCLLKRQAILLPPPFRLVYTGLLQTLFYEIAPYLSSGVHSYRQYPEVDHDAKEYPFPSDSTKHAWLGFKHGFNAALYNDDGGKWGVITDITMFFERIEIERLVSVLRDIIPPDRQSETASSLELLKQALLWCSKQGIGVPQNYDASSFFCSAFLTPVDREMSKIEGVYYSRWMDDIRIAAPTRGEAIKALHQLQDELARYGLGVNAQKTILIEPGSTRYKDFLAADEDDKLHRLSEVIATRHENTIRTVIPEFIEAIERCDAAGNDRFLRAYSNRLLQAAQFVEVREGCLKAVRDLALKGFRERPEKADYWCKFLSPDVSAEVQHVLCDFLGDPDYNCHDWTNQWAVIALCRAKVPEKCAIDILRHIAFGGGCVPIKAHAVAALGQWQDNLERRKLADKYITGETEPVLRRAAVMAIQQLPKEDRDQYYQQAVTIDPDLKVLIDYLLSRERPFYSVYAFPTCHCVAEPSEPPPAKHSGVGLVNGRWARFQIRSWYYPDYD